MLKGKRPEVFLSATTTCCIPVAKLNVALVADQLAVRLDELVTKSLLQGLQHSHSSACALVRAFPTHDRSYSKLL